MHGVYGAWLALLAGALWWAVVAVRLRLYRHLLGIIVRLKHEAGTCDGQLMVHRAWYRCHWMALHLGGSLPFQPPPAPVKSAMFVGAGASMQGKETGGVP